MKEINSEKFEIDKFELLEKRVGREYKNVLEKEFDYCLIQNTQMNFAKDLVLGLLMEKRQYFYSN